MQDGSWQLFSTGRGRLRVLDARRPASVSSLRRNLTAEPPDLCLFLQAEPRRPEEVDADLEQASQLLRVVETAPDVAEAKPPRRGLAQRTRWLGAGAARAR